MTVVGRQVFAQEIASPGGELDWRRGDWDALIYSPIDIQPDRGSLPDRRRLHGYLDRFSLAFGCFDFALEATGDSADPYRWIFIE
ncbi:hypothetical protein GCM10009555_008340 [Acrocarpospora macrocephala]|uniref:Uncharacterized protein n=1 Tax=Acrocarpospora macrocephala TaxID=150177 RepID=A0A5M3WWB7_9ACTN|nr:hypothetical protein [Acrocarpospora macrocephala]GES13040.1 hypothetical protein Amac_066370 [Acrocarpospora macrocephala]